MYGLIILTKDLCHFYPSVNSFVIISKLQVVKTAEISKYLKCGIIAFDSTIKLFVLFHF